MEIITTTISQALAGIPAVSVAAPRNRRAAVSPTVSVSRQQSALIVADGPAEAGVTADSSARLDSLEEALV